MNRSLQKFLKKQTSKKNLKLVGQEGVKILIERTQGKGQGVEELGGRKQKLKPLAKSTKKRRKSFKGLSPNTTPGRSNLTFTGKLMESISFNTRVKSLRFRITGNKNKKIAEYVSKDRPFFNFSKMELSKLLRLYKKLTGGK